MAEVERAHTLDSRSGRLAKAEYFGIEAVELELMQLLCFRGTCGSLARLTVYSCAICAHRPVGLAQS